jgi:hypothetical protein
MSLADILYGKPAEPAAPAPSPTPAPPAPATAAPTPATPEKDLASRLYGESVPDKYDLFTVPEELKHLNLGHDEPRFQEFSATARQMGLSQAKAQELVNLHLRHAYGGKR